MIDDSRFILPHPELAAEIYYLPPEQCGRQVPVRSGYRGQFYYHAQNWDATQQFIDTSQCSPGETISVLLQTASPSQHAGKFHVGKYFEIREGTIIVGAGHITKILDPTFQRISLGQYDSKISDIILASDKISVQAVNNLDSVRYTYFDADKYSTIKSFIQEKKWYKINYDRREQNGFREYLDILTFSDQDGKEYAVSIYDNDELWQDPEIIDIFSFS